MQYFSLTKISVTTLVMFIFMTVSFIGWNTSLMASSTDLFSDISSSPYKDAILFIKTAGIVEGYSDGTFKPDSEINRAEFTKIVVQTAFPKEIEPYKVESTCFVDVQSAYWYAKYVCLAKDKGVIGGYPDGTFRPDQNINAAEALKITLEALAEDTIVDTVGPWYQKYLDYAYGKGIMLGEWFDVSKKVTRGEMAQFIYQIKQEPLSIGLPARLKIPAISIDAEIESVGLTPNGAMDIPKSAYDVAWYSPGPRPGEVGSAVMSGHLDWYGVPEGVFYNLDKLKQGDKLYILDDKGKSIFFEVRKIRYYDYEVLVPEVFISDSGIHLNLVTCGGEWIKAKNSYTKRLVVFTDIVY